MLGIIRQKVAGKLNHALVICCFLSIDDSGDLMYCVSVCVCACMSEKERERYQ